MKSCEIEVVRLRLIEAERIATHIRKTKACLSALEHPEVRITIGVRVPDIGSAIKAQGATMSTEMTDGHPGDFRGFACVTLFRELATKAILSELKALEQQLEQI